MMANPYSSNMGVRNMRVKFAYYIRFCDTATILGGTSIIFTDLHKNRYRVDFDSREQTLIFYEQVLKEGYVDVSAFHVW